MPSSTREERRYELVALIDELEDRLAKFPDNPASAQASVEHCGLQASYWRAMAAKASAEHHDACTRENGPRKGWASEDRAMQILSMSTDKAEKWEARKNRAEERLIADRLERVIQNQEARKKATNRLSELKKMKS